ncbi:C2HC5 finger protein [Aspergillus taichungensis]|uniref:C2HC5 finger protein n=1 Tax=Aspergillus taichungensis TaxID=482145 RepID=A0A2J5HWA6_9EURO|nr:C2HC5 finger protein [Aspergillus taichungensis]
MSDPGLISWAVPRVSQLLPLDEESLTQIISYAASLPTEESAEHLKNLLGDSPAVFEFISAFNARRSRADTTSTATSSEATARNTNKGPGPASKKGKKSKPPLHSSGPPRRPENYGNVSGGYKKEDQEEVYMPTSSRSQHIQNVQGTVGKGAGAGASPSANAQLSVPSSREGSAAASRTQSPAPGKAPPSASGPMISDLLPNVKSKAAKSSRSGGSGAANSSKASLTTTNISDLTAAIAALEMSTNPTLGNTGPQKCNCYATIHPLFDPAPNCLNCGKIICSLEGLQPCSFCGTPLLSPEEIQSMIKELRAERGQEKMRVHNEGVQRESRPRIGAEPSSSSQLDAAKAHRDKLLNFQAQNAKRTRVVDEAADFETPNVASTIWMSPAQRALALKKQQRIMREMEEKARPEWEKKQTVMSLDIKGGRLRRVYQSAPTESSRGDDQTDELTETETGDGDEAGNRNGGRAFSHNPLLAAGGLPRPVWKAADGKQQETRREPKQTWRRVQDDNDDNEQWILDGGVHGYS